MRILQTFCHLYDLGHFFLLQVIKKWRYLEAGQRKTKTMNVKLLTITTFIVILLLSTVDESDARLCVGSRFNCRANPRLSARGITCSGRRSGHVCRGHGLRGCRCLPGLSTMLASKGHEKHFPRT